MTLAEIKAAVIRRAHRSDLTAQVPLYLQFAEQDYNLRTNGSHRLTEEADGAESWLSIYAPLVYIYGGLMQMAIDTQDDTALQRYAILYERAADAAHYAEVRDSGIMDEAMSTDVNMTVRSNILTGDE